jgi:hypothetical protein
MFYVKTNDLKITLISVKSFTCKQSKHGTVPNLRLRGVMLAPSGSGKTVLLAYSILKVYRGCFERMYMFSPGVNVDQTWEAVKQYQEDVTKVRESDKEQLYYDHYNTEDLEKIIETQSKVILHMKKQKHSHLFSVLVIVDDFADDPSFSRHFKLLHSLFTRGRHNRITTIVSTQKFTAVAPIIKVNATFLCVYRLRNTKDLETFLEELSALTPRKELIEIYHLATREPYSFFVYQPRRPSLERYLLHYCHAEDILIILIL